MIFKIQVNGRTLHSIQKTPEQSEHELHLNAARIVRKTLQASGMEYEAIEYFPGQKINILSKQLETA
jgi:hypothetical protein